MTRMLTRPDGRIAYDDAGEGPLVVLVPGMGDTRGQYRHLAPRLVASGHRVVTVDLRGLGESDTGFATYRPEDVGADVVALLEALDARGAVLVGSSMAAASVAWAAAEVPDRVGGVVVLGPFARDVPMNPVLGWVFAAALAGPWGRHLWTWWYGKLHVGGVADDHGAHVAALRANLGEPARMAAFRAMAAASKAACAARLGDVRSPALVLMGGADPDFPDPAAEAAWVAEQLGGVAEVLPGLGHYPHVERPDAVAERIAAFVTRGEVRWRAQA